MKTYYLFNPGRLSRKDNTLKFLPIDEEGNEGQPKYIPVEDVDNLYIFGNLDANSSLYNFLGKNKITVHFFDYYEHYTGSFMPKEYLQAGKVQVAQTQLYLDGVRRLVLAQYLIEGAARNMLRNVRYYQNRGKNLAKEVTEIETLIASIGTVTSTEALMGIEGNIRMAYYSAFDAIIDDFPMDKRSKQPPLDEVNALISFGNMLCYTACLDQIYHTQLNPTISFLHQPGARRYSLALDLAEIFKPVLVDRMIFSLLNKKQLQKNDFDQRINSVRLKESSRKKLLREWDQRLKDTFKHASLKRMVSYKHAIRLECYKLSKHILGIDTYKPFVLR
ncbi:MAG: type I-B CRISPR-associated endonuclease Cas1b [Thermonemataceae bacterium]